MMRSLTSSRPAWSASRTARAPGDVVGVLGALVPRQLQDGVQPGADPAGLGGLVAGALQLVDLLERGLAHLLGQVGGLDAGAVVLLLASGVAVQLGQLLADGLQLRRSRNSRCCFSMPSWTSLRMVSATSCSARWSRSHSVASFAAGRPGRRSPAAGPSARCSGRARSRSCRRAATGRRSAGRGRRPARRRACCSQLVASALYSLTSSATAPGSGSATARRATVRLHPQGRAGAGGAGADADPVDAADHGGGVAVGQPADLLDGRQRADARRTARRSAAPAAPAACPARTRERGGLRRPRRRRGPRCRTGPAARPCRAARPRRRAAGPAG